jgi:hypothetical protein
MRNKRFWTSFFDILIIESQLISLARCWHLLGHRVSRDRISYERNSGQDSWAKLSRDRNSLQPTPERPAEIRHSSRNGEEVGNVLSLSGCADTLPPLILEGKLETMIDHIADWPKNTHQSIDGNTDAFPDRE